MSKTKTTTETKKPGTAEKSEPVDGGWRETVESIAMAVILALLFRGFVAEAFVIPTGSMAPTLVGRHKDVKCPQCGIRYQVSCSPEAENEVLTGRHVIDTTCSVCRYTQRLNPLKHPNIPMVFAEARSDKIEGVVSVRLRRGGRPLLRAGA